MFNILHDGGRVTGKNSQLRKPTVHRLRKDSFEANIVATICMLQRFDATCCSGAACLQLVVSSQVRDSSPN
jgi:hypothetical protein